MTTTGIGVLAVCCTAEADGDRAQITAKVTLAFRSTDLQNGYDAVEADEVLLNKTDAEKSTPAIPRRGSK